ncbi:hypothetical protein WMY93_032343 [Mugilogobius chulae]|uniref:Proteasome subunit beta type-4 n=1 Tax=Mugilogobius chulae TaxID=88201 RepID=A0AAW0MSJ0_9GOBI
MIAADMLGSYGSLARFRNISRLMKVNNNTILGASGDYADYQHLKQVIEQMVRSLLVTRVMYNRRSRMNPLWNTVVLGGFYQGEGFLGYVDKLGVAYEAPTVATGFGAYLAQRRPLLQQGTALNTLKTRLKVLYYRDARSYNRDARSYNRYEIATVTAEGVEIIGPLRPRQTGTSTFGQAVARQIRASCVVTGQNSGPRPIAIIRACRRHDSWPMGARRGVVVRQT